MPLRYDRAVLTARLRAVPAAPVYGTAMPRQAATPDQLLLFTREQQSAVKARRAVDLAALRTILEDPELTAGQTALVTACTGDRGSGAQAGVRFSGAVGSAPGGSGRRRR